VIGDNNFTLINHGLIEAEGTASNLNISTNGTLNNTSGTIHATQGGNVTASILSSGSVVATNAGTITISKELALGGVGGSHLLIENAGTVQIGGEAGDDPAQGFDAAPSAGDISQSTVTGNKSRLINTGRFVVGDASIGSLSIQSGGAVITAPGALAGVAGLVIGNTAGASGSSVSVIGVGSNLQVTGLLDVGVAGSGSMLLNGGATVTATSLNAGNLAAAIGQISLIGSGTELLVTGAATVADDGTGVLSILAGATFAATSLTIGAQSNSSGALIISGAGSVINLSGALNIGTSLGIGDLTVGPGAAVHASVVNLQGQVVLEGGLLDPTVQLINQGQTEGGFGTIAADNVIDEGVIQAGGGAQHLLVVDGTVLGGGTLTVNGTVRPAGGAGELRINAGATLELMDAVLSAASTTFTDDLAQPGTYTLNNSVIDVTFAEGTGVLLLDDIAEFGGAITSFTHGDAFVITGGTLTSLGVSNGNTLTVSDSGAGAGADGIDRIIFGSAVSAAEFNIVNGNTVQVACFAEGTWIATEAGPVAVENLAVGDCVITHDGRAEPIVWIGQRMVNCNQNPKPDTVWPVQVRTGAFGPRLPARDLFLSPDHAVFVSGVLIPVKLLINGTSINQVKRSTITYYHVELQWHDVIRAEGLPVESYFDIGDQANFHEVGETIRLFPEFMVRLTPDTAILWETCGAAPLVMAGPQLVAIQRQVSALAEQRAGLHEVA
jgi:T5SS/PEP-CTERM-associated repeat protein